MSSKDDKVETFFRKASNHYKELEVNDADWQKMEALLDAEATRAAAIRTKRRTRGAAAAGIIVLFLTATYLIVPRIVTPDAQITGIAAHEGVSSAKEQEPMTPEARLEAQEKPGEGGTSSQPAFDSNVSASKHVDGAEGSAVGLKNDAKGAAVQVLKATAPASGEKSQSAVTPVYSRKEGESTGIPGIEENKRSVGSGLNTPDHLDKHNELVTPEGSQTREVGPRPDDRLPVSEKEVDNAVEMAGDHDQDLPVREASRWGVSLLAAPDFSATRDGSYTSPGTAFGLAVHYRMADRWMISTGVLYSEKLYWGHGYEYHPPYGYWNAVTNGVVPEKIDGDCDVIEVPVSIAFNILEKERSRVFVSAGVSSYFMQSERYSYTFDTPNPGAATGWATENPSSYWFGIGNISAGYDWRVNAALSIGIEPYLKIPFAEVGWANIELFSAGVLFAARYRFLKAAHDRPPSNAP